MSSEPEASESLPVGLYRRPDSRCLWYAISVGGISYRGSTKTGDVSEAIETLRDIRNAAELQAEHRIVSHKLTRRVNEEIKDEKSNISQCIKKMHRSCTKNARAKGIDLTVEEVKELVFRSRGYCEVTGVPLDFSKNDGAEKNPFAPSIDRINNTVGYTYINCRVVCTIANYAMNVWGEKALFELVRNMITHRLDIRPESAWDRYEHSREVSRRSKVSIKKRPKNIKLKSVSTAV